MTKKLESLEDVGQLVGLKPGEATSILAEVQKNHAVLRACTRHQFANRIPGKLGQKYTCLNCGGVMSGERVSVYAEGVRHCGEPFPVWIDTPEPPA